ncbi:hypothetical protein HAX54_013892 [Datura stramonium]|uniref:non-specific serine/threonine protein kinase n=1 Tax=Datura stramonium TaxID=4076 RepID=A0ABS8TNY1_DATST|nr:hypothetical protein [Datura stramonium]
MPACTHLDCSINIYVKHCRVNVKLSESCCNLIFFLFQARPLLAHALEKLEFDQLADPRLEKNYVVPEMFQMIEAAAACVRHSAAKRPGMGQIMRAFENMSTSDLTNGMKVGESTIYNSAEQSAEIRLFRRMAFGSPDFSSDFFSQGTQHSGESAEDKKMEDKNIFAADCIVICCCCQCLILQIIILFLLNLPYKLLKKTKECIKKLRYRRRNKKTMEMEINRHDEGEILKDHGGSLRVQLESLCCMEEVEKVLEEFSQKGEFAFGSFWGVDEDEVLETERITTCIHKQTVDYDVFQTHLIQVFGSFNLQ